MKNKTQQPAAPVQSAAPVAQPVPVLVQVNHPVMPTGRAGALSTFSAKVEPGTVGTRRGGFKLEMGPIGVTVTDELNHYLFPWAEVQRVEFE